MTESDTPRVDQGMITPSQVIENGHRIFAGKIDLLVTERAKELRKASQDLRIEVARLNNELTAARAELAKYKSIAETAINDHEASEIRNHLLTEQRDRLAEAHKLIANQLMYDELNEYQIEHADWETAYDELIKISREALQSLTSQVCHESRALTARC